MLTAVDTKVFIDSIMRQTTVLIGQFAATAGIRAPLARLADEVFLSLSRELESQGVSRKLVADMFGMALRSYQRRVQRLRESANEEGKTLWQSVLEHLEEQGGATRLALLERFSNDDPDALGAVLNDLVHAGLASKTGSGASALFAVTAEEDRQALAREGKRETAAALVWLDLCRHPGAAVSEMAARIGVSEELVQNSLVSLRDRGRITVHPDGHLSADPMVIPVGAKAGWEAAVFDHFQAVAAAITTKLRQGATRSNEADTTGGSTLVFEVHDQHPLAQQVLDSLARVRREMFELWNQVEAVNAQEPIAEERIRRVTFYFGQFVKSSGEGP